MRPIRECVAGQPHLGNWAQGSTMGTIRKAKQSKAGTSIVSQGATSCVEARVIASTALDKV